MTEDKLISMLKSKDVEVCKKAIREIAILNDKKYFLPVYRVLRTAEDKWLKVEAFETLEKLDKEKMFIFSLDNLESEDYSDIKAWFIACIGRHGNSRHLDLIRKFLNDPDPRVRADTAEALENLGEPDIENKLLPLVEDPNHRVKATVCKILWKYGAFRVIGILKRMLTQEPNKWHRAAAAFALGEIGGFQVLDLLYLALKDKEPEVIRNAIKSLAKCGEISSIPEILNFLKYPDISVRHAAIEALGIIKSEESIKPLLNLLETTNDIETIDKIGKALMNISEFLGKKIIGQLVLYLRNPSPNVRIITCRCLAMIGEPSVVPFLERVAREDKEEKIREEAQKAVEKIQDRGSQ